MLMFTTFERARLILLCGLGLKAESETRKGFEIVLCTGASSVGKGIFSTNPTARVQSLEPTREREGTLEVVSVLVPRATASMHGAVFSAIIFR